MPSANSQNGLALNLLARVDFLWHRTEWNVLDLFCIFTCKHVISHCFISKRAQK